MNSTHPVVRSYLRLLLPVVVATLLLAGYLSAMVGPMCAKMVLPRFGGSVEIWHVSYLMMQGALLLGILIAFLIDKFVMRTQFSLLGLLLAAAGCTLLPQPFNVRDWPLPEAGHELASLAAVMAVRMLPPCAAVGTTLLLAQAWFARSSHPAAKDPYFLFSATMLGQAFGIAVYPRAAAPQTAHILRGGLPLSRGGAYDSSG